MSTLSLPGAQGWVCVGITNLDGFLGAKGTHRDRTGILRIDDSLLDKPGWEIAAGLNAERIAFDVLGKYGTHLHAKEPFNLF